MALMKVAVFGAKGRMGREVVRTVQQAPDLQTGPLLDVGDGLEDLARADVAVVFSSPDVALEHALACVRSGVHAVVGTTGWTRENLDIVRAELRGAPGVGVLVAPNFSLGAVLLMRFAEQAAEHFESVEVIELHHPDKVDAPSGTAQHTAQLVARAREKAGQGPSPDATATELAGARGAQVDGVRVHSVRLRGLVAHQEVLLGAPGETLTLRHDSFDRACFMPGVLLGIRTVGHRPGLTVGLEHYLPA
ncbi:MAG: 4-hydroxy-tetrahydrodipicolinate reductase [Actinomycetota bacterium]|nr:4-hydroxy-tetrahydrodipicolinate reductase [Actinomycetota bacterium]